MSASYMKGAKSTQIICGVQIKTKCQILFQVIVLTTQSMETGVHVYLLQAMSARQIKIVQTLPLAELSASGPIGPVALGAMTP